MAEKGTILVTGGAGYIGSHTIIELQTRTDLHVLSADNYSNSTAETYSRIERITGKAVPHADVDLTDLQATRKLFEKHPGITGIIHFAAFKSVPESVEKPLLYYRNNIGSLVNILEAARDFAVRNIIFSSSCSVYGNIHTLPVHEETPLGKPESPYAYTKQIGEKIVEDFVRAMTGTRAISLRYFNPVGAHMSGLIGELPLNRPNNLVPVITQTAAGRIPQMTVFGDDYDTRDGTCVRDYVHVSDIAEAHVKALDVLFKSKAGSSSGIINLGTGNGVTVLEALRAFETVTGVRPNYVIGQRRDGDVGAIYSDCTKAQQQLGWKPRYSLDDMMSSAWKWQQQLGSELAADQRSR